MQTEPAALRWAWRTWPVLVVLAAVALVTAHRFENALVWDDGHLIEVAARLNEHGQPWQVFRRSVGALVHEREQGEGTDLDLYRPLPLLAFVVGYARFGADPVPQHAFNLGLHLACVLLVYLFAVRRDPAPHPASAALAAAWFGLTPHLAEAHVWISGRFDVMCALFVLVALHLSRAAWARSGAPRLCFEAAACVAYFFALLSKETAVLALLPLAFVPVPCASLKERGRRCLPFASALVPYWVLRASALGSSGAAFDLETWLEGAARFGAVAIDAVTSLLLPLRVYSRLPKEDYDALSAGGLFACAAAAALLGYAAWRARTRLPWWTFGVGWLFALLLPVALLSAKPWPGFGRFLYLPAALLFVGAADLVLHLYGRLQSAFARRGLALALAVHVHVLAAFLHAYTYDFRDEAALFESIVAAAPERSHGYGFLGIHYIERRDFARAVVLLQKAVSIAPDDRRFSSKLGQALLFSGQHEAARAHARAAIARFDEAPEFYLLEAYTWLDQDPERAARGVLECLRIRHDHEEGLEALSFLRNEHPRAERFRAAFDRLAEEPRYAELRGLWSAQ